MLTKWRQVGMAVAATAAAGLLTAGCGSTSHVTEAAPSWHQPSVGAPSGATFCRLLGVDYGHIRVVGSTDSHRIAAAYAGFYAAAPSLISSAPASIRPDARIFVTTAVDFYRDVLARDLDHANAAGALTRDLASPATAPAIRATLVWAAAACHPDPLPAPSSATAPTTTTVPSGHGIGTQGSG